MISEKIMEIGIFIKILSVLMFLLSLCMKLNSISASEVRCIDRERQALLKFKHGLVDDHGILSSWGSEEVKKECCKWKGISCSKRIGHVVSLDLHVPPSDGYVYLEAAKLSPALLELQHLNYLELEIKNLEWLSHLSLLLFLDLSGANLVNQTSWLHHMTRFPFLEELYLSYCQLPNIMPSFNIFTNSSLPYMSILDLSSNDLTSSFAFHCASLTYIDLSYNRLDGPIPDAFGELIFLEKLFLNNNTFRREGWVVPKSLGNLSHLYYLDISYNELNGPLTDVTKFSSLKFLILNNNKLNGFHPHSPGLPSSLESSELFDNQFRRLREGTEKLSNLQYLRMSSNLLEDAFPNWLWTMSLFRLDLSHNNISVCISLKYYTCAKNFIDELPSTLRNCTRLRTLDVGDNKLTGRISRCLNNITALAQKNSSIEYGDWKFYHRYNPDYVNNAFVQWKGQDPEHKTLGLLKGIDLSRNKLFGPIPQEFSALRGLVFLNLSRNHLTRNIISNIGQMEKLECLDLSQNQLSGKIPNNLAHLNFLGVLDLSYNNLTGKILLGTQLQSFNSSMYAGNSQLCGDISNSYVIDHRKGNIFEEDDGFIIRHFYICMAFDFITGFWESLLGNKKVLTIIQTSCWLERCRDYAWQCFYSSYRHCLIF
ncbi:LRR receptor-like serine/threonine-protein kinase GSO1 [Olea europaea var. sylvestris]|uniref:LRR receptor-like serine/threonine-protein kinase GSO1 n=1 Tax=Olea europaea var. sylvestris TaxID=158386 RepID=UPI000C1D8A7B|nr:LRR receptor-like serine/threonine-protein kinase GSO1 [Olea europaea var. sylvestris]